MENVTDLNRLKDPFEAADLEWRVQSSGLKEGRPWARVMPYIDSRTIMDRLDAVCGIENVQVRYEKGPDGGVICGIGVRVNGEWVWKWDGAETPEDEVAEERKNHVDPVKTSLTNAYKRAAVQWGVGRYLYSLPAGFAVFAENGRYQSKIKDASYRWNPPTLEAAPVNPPAEKKGKPAESKPTGQATGFQERRKDIWEACLAMSGGDLDAAGKILQNYAGVSVVAKLSPKMVEDIYGQVIDDLVRFRG